MGLDLLKRCSSICVLATVLFSGCSTTDVLTPNNTVKKDTPSWILDPSKNGKYTDAVSACYVNTNNYSMKKVKKILSMKLKSSYAATKHTSVERKQTKYNSSYKSESYQTSSKSYSNKYTVLDKYKANNKYCLYANFE